MPQNKIYTKTIDITEDLVKISIPLQTQADLDPLLDMIGKSKYVLLGEASHGTSEYYTRRMEISKRLIEEKEFSFIAVEGDWADCYEINRFVKGYRNSSASAHDVLRVFRRWPTWMWANFEMAGFMRWLKGYNHSVPDAKKVGFYGLDLYGLWESLNSIIKYLEKVRPEAVESAYQAFRCFEPYGEDMENYARAAALVPHDCEDDVLKLLSGMKKEVTVYPDDAEAKLNLYQNALVVRNAEKYYRTLMGGGADSWNLRDQHMAESLDALMDFHGNEARGIIWEHNTHIGDARATDMLRAGMFNVGQLVREKHEQEGVSLIGFGSYEGSVIAGSHWGAPMEEMIVPEAAKNSWEEILHQTFLKDRILLLNNIPQNSSLFKPRGHRAIGVVYHPESDAFSNYVPTVLPNRYNAFIYLEKTKALKPILMAEYREGEPGETFPFGE
jgi:erythromycin esterase